jgi:hypothetical protein
MDAMHRLDPFLRRPTTDSGKVAVTVGLPMALLAVVLIVTGTVLDSGALTFLTFLAMMGTLVGGVAGVNAVAFRGERSPLVLLAIVPGLLVLLFVLGEALFSA